MRRVLSAALLACAVLGVAGAADGASDGSREFVVLYEKGASTDAAHAAIEAAGGKIVDENTAIGLATVRTDDASFAADVAKSPAVVGAAANRAIGRAPAGEIKKRDGAEDGGGVRGSHEGRRRGKAKGDPLSPLQWDMQMIHATPDGSYRVEQGSKDVRVGVIDTGIDGNHPDIRKNFDRKLSRNFTVDDPLVDGACDTDPDGSCEDPADVDENGHGTHVASNIGAPLNGEGIGGIAPRVDLVNLRAGQDSGFFFLGPTVNALTYAGDHGIDVVNMSFFIDPWLYNCPSDTRVNGPDNVEQRTIIEATQRAIDYARAHGVTTIAALGNEHTDLGNPTSDDISPDYPGGTEIHRTVDNTCLTMPTEADGVISVSAIGPSKTKADYSNYGEEQTDVSAPGGYFRDFFGTPQHRTPQNEILGAYPKEVGIEEGTIDPATGEVLSPFVVRDGDGYYQWIQGTSMASPHAVGVAALIVARFGHRDRRNGGLTLAPDRVEQILRGTATNTPCPTPATVDYTVVGRSADFNATCTGTPDFNGFYGDGIVDAFNAVTAARGRDDD